MGFPSLVRIALMITPFLKYASKPIGKYLLWMSITGVGLSQQQALTNASIETLAKGRVGEYLLLQMIDSQPGTYDLSPEALVTLKQAGASERVLSEIISKAAESASPKVTIGDLDIGVYFKQNKQWVPVAAEHVNWKSGGVLKNVATEGVVKGDINGHIEGAGSTTSIEDLEFLIRTPAGVDGTDFELVYLHKGRNGREFRRVTGGVFHSSGGSTRDEIRFGQTKIGDHAYKITVPSLQAGEYAFLAPGLSASTASWAMGKAYTFHLATAEAGWHP